MGIPACWSGGGKNGLTGRSALPNRGRAVLPRRPNSTRRPTDFMHAAKVRPVFRSFHQFVPDRIFSDVLPFLRVAFAIAQAMMKAACLKSSRVGMRLGEAVFPKCDPAFDGEIQIARRTEQVQMVGQKQIITDEPGGSLVFPNLMQRTLDGCLCQPTLAFSGADGEEDPVWPADRNVNVLRGRMASGSAERDFRHGGIFSGEWDGGKEFSPHANARDGRNGQSGRSALP